MDITFSITILVLSVVVSLGVGYYIGKKSTSTDIPTT